MYYMQAVGIFSVVLCAIICITHISSVVCFDKISDLQIPTHEKYLYTCGDKGLSLGKVTKEQEQQNIISLIECLGNGGIQKIAPKMKQEKANKFREVLRQMKTGHWRLRRQVSNEVQPRKEVRMLSPAEWQILKIRLNSVRESGFYQTIVDFFSDESIAGTNGGPAFLGWHRVALLWLEFYLHVPIPYWDCTLDFHITDPTKSILWTKEYFGNGEGTVRVGPFMNFTESDGTPITRRIGQAGSLIARENVDSLMTRKSNRELVYTTNIALEEYHNGVQAWVGGSMSGLLTAPSDPIYFFHQCYIDKLWEDVRQNMKAAEDYPFDPAITNPLQNPEYVLAKFPFDSRYPLANSDSYTRHVSARAHYSSSPAQATQAWECKNPVLKRKHVLVWDTDRQYCVTGQGSEKDFHIIPDLHTSAKIVVSTLNSPMNFPLDSPFNSPLPKKPKIKYVAPLKDIRAIYRAGNSMKKMKEAPKIISSVLEALSSRLKNDELDRVKSQTQKSFSTSQQSVVLPNNHVSPDSRIFDHPGMSFGRRPRVVAVLAPPRASRIHKPFNTPMSQPQSFLSQSPSELSSIAFKLFQSPAVDQRRSAVRAPSVNPHLLNKKFAVSSTINVLESLLTRLRSMPR
ncbi:uncharacterized protein LOC132561427 [Ylistrum balloti]|uniref:uncharacterized protein LOC132560883 n=1 Tax=Ylistrum balloti TaxID=509963 RepID=UPI002905BF8B|nr:uncharacterized protein LOC132560883 [Ylistrum balloti]XP_060082140.1 uncharacterized protein LOC132561427 [Ylistrum balloti]